MQFIEVCGTTIFYDYWPFSARQDFYFEMPKKYVVIFKTKTLRNVHVVYANFCHLIHTFIYTDQVPGQIIPRRHFLCQQKGLITLSIYFNFDTSPFELWGYFFHDFIYVHITQG